ncbi:MAG: TPM domain-containing protein, partial [Vicinamibacterales bacterium]
MRKTESRVALMTRMSAALCLLLIVIAATARAESLASIPNPRVQNGTWVTDTTATLTPELVAVLNEHIAAFERDTGSEMAVVVIRSLDGLSIEEASEKLFRMWGIGKKKQDNGLLFLWSTGDRRVRVEVGYGLEGALPDGKVGAILDQYVIARFKEQRFD